MAIDLNQLLSLLSLEANDRIDMPPVPGGDPACAVAMPEERSFDRWQEADVKAREHGYCAIGIGLKDNVHRLVEHVENVPAWNPARALNLATSLNVDQWFREREGDILEDAGELPSGQWKDPDSPPSPGLWFPFEKGVHLNPWWMGLVPAQEPWQVPLSLAYGNWNDCPDPTVHAAIARHWQREYGADLVAVGPDTIEFLVERPPATPEAAMSLAREQYLYCPDIVDQGIGTVAALGASLLGNSTWSFWWD